MNNGSIDNLLDHVKNVLDVKRDVHLANKLGISHAVISQLRNDPTRSVGPALILHIHDATGISVNTIRDLGNLKRPKFEVKT